MRSAGGGSAEALLCHSNSAPRMCCWCAPRSRWWSPTPLDEPCQTCARVCRCHVPHKQVVWPSPGGQPHHKPERPLVDDMPSASTCACFDKAVIIRPRAPPPGRQTPLCGVEPSAAFAAAPPMGTSSRLGELPPVGGTKKEDANSRTRSSCHILHVPAHACPNSRSRCTCTHVQVASDRSTRRVRA